MAEAAPIDPQLLAAEIEAAVAEFNRLANLASSIGMTVIAELSMEQMVDRPPRPILRIQAVG